MDRRKFLKAGLGGVVGTVAGGIGLLKWTPRAEAATVNAVLNVVKGPVAMIDGTSAFVFSYSEDTTPVLSGPTILCQTGDTVVVSVTNTLQTPVTFKVGRTDIRTVIPAGQSGSFSFAAPAAGTYLYYDDQNSGVNRCMGLYGAMVVMPAGLKDQSFVGGPAFVRQLKWVFGSIDPVWGSQVETNGDGFVTSIKPSTFMPRYFLINGTSFDANSVSNTKLSGGVNEGALVRILNGGGMVHSPHFHGNHISWVSINGTNYTEGKLKDIVPMLPMDVKDVLYPCAPPPDAWPQIGSPAAVSPLNQWPQVYPMHCHSEMSQTAAGGLYPHGLHTSLTIGAEPAAESDLTTAVSAL